MASLATLAAATAVRRRLPIELSQSINISDASGWKAHVSAGSNVCYQAFSLNSSEVKNCRSLSTWGPNFGREQNVPSVNDVGKQ